METRSIRHSIRSERRPPKIEGGTERPRPAAARPAESNQADQPVDRALIGLKHLF